jgi:tRNA modification GTPase
MVRSPSSHDSIVAVSSPPGSAARGLLRFSGPSAHELLDALLAKPLTPVHPPHTLYPVRLAAPPIPAMAHYQHAPASYTGEPTAELQAPGQPALLERLIQNAIEAGGRLAEPGEFTFRAFTAGKLDLTQAEGVAATISAVSDSQLRAATLLREGQLGQIAARLVDDLSSTLALVEAGIDFSDEEDVSPIAPEALRERLAQMRDELGGLLSRSRSWSAVEALPRVVLMGPPSSGKTALFNALLGKQRAVVDPTPGTTRDALTEPCTLHDAQGRAFEVMLVDVAGLDAPTAALDAAIQQTARDTIERADLIVTLQAMDSASSAPAIDVPEHCPRLPVQTKSDLVAEPIEAEEADALPISSVTGQNLDALKRRIAEQLSQRAVSLTADMLALQPRHEQAIRTAIDELSAASTQLPADSAGRHIPEPELTAARMRAALDALAGLGGDMTPDDVLGKVFATFCIGK